MARVKYLDTITGSTSKSSFISKEVRRHGLNIAETKEFGKSTIVVLNGERDLKVILALIAVLCKKCEKVINIVKSNIKGINNWHEVLKGELSQFVNVRELKSIMLIGDIDDEEKYKMLKDSLKNYVDERSQGNVFTFYYNSNIRVIITFNGDLGDNKFSRHEIEEDILNFLNRIADSLEKVGLKLPPLSGDPKDIYKSLIDKYRQSSKKQICDDKEISDLDMAVIHHMLLNRDIVEEVFRKQVTAIRELLKDP
ncbi:MAG: hypothetical protein OWQ54_05960 [Sulfolobaceae archaeon]|nr:hypothetical protein [Sulfolobaceae archaeon]